jgi:outer membrane translocation and assembly module TamA
VQTEYNRRIIGPVGLLAFYDAGKVTVARSDLNFNNLHQGFGGGFAFFLAGRVVFRAYVGL